MQKTTAALSAVATAALIAGAAAPAFAATTPPSLTTVKNAAVADIEGKLLWLGIVDYGFSTDKNVLPADRTTLLPRAQADSTTLKTLLPAVQNAGTVAAVRSAMTQVAALQVFAFVLPQLNTVRTSDDLAADETAFAAKESAFRSAITAAANAHKNVTAANAALADFTVQVTDAQALSTAAHHAVSLTIATPGAALLTAIDGLDNFKSTLHVLAAIADAGVITRTTGPIT